MIFEIIVSSALAVIIFIGGFFIGQNTKETVKNEYITQATTVNQRTETVQQNIQGQLTIIDTKTNINININQLTNFLRLTNFVTSNSRAETNIRR